MVKKVLKWVGISIASLVGLVSVAIAVVLYFVFTPERLTPMVRDIAQEYIASDFEIKGVELTFFSTFPDFSVKIDTLSISQLNDTIQPLIFARHTLASINPMSLLDGEVKVNRVTLDGADINLYVDSLIGPLKIFKLPESDTVAVDTLSDGDDYLFTLDKIEILSSSITIDDRTRNFYTKLDSMSMELSASLSTGLIDFDLLLDLPDIVVELDDVSYASGDSFSLDANMRYEADSMLLSITQADMVINSIDLTTLGWLRADSTFDAFSMDIYSTLTTPSIAEFLRIIPSTIIDGKESLTTDGTVDLAIELKGVYDSVTMPLLTADVDIENARAKYNSRKLSIEEIDCDMKVYLDMNDEQKSYAAINRFKLRASDIIDLSVKGKVSNMIIDPYMDLSLVADFDFSRFTELFPLGEGIVLEGQNKSDLSAKLTLSDITDSNFGAFYISGESIFSDMVIAVDAEQYTGDSTYTGSLYLDIEEGKFLFGDNVREGTESRTLLSDVNLSGLALKDKEGQYVIIENLDMKAGASFDNKTKRVNGVGVTVNADNLSGGIEQELDVDMKSTEIALTLIPRSKQTKMKITGSLKSDSLSAYEYINNSEMALRSADLEFNLAQKNKKDWDIQGDVGFSRLSLVSDLFPLDISLTKSKVAVANDVVTLSNTRLKVGESEIVATGSVSNLFSVLFGDERPQQARNSMASRGSSASGAGSGAGAGNVRSGTSRNASQSGDTAQRDNAAEKGGVAQKGNVQGKGNTQGKAQAQKSLEGKLTIRSKSLNLTELMEATNQCVLLSDTTYYDETTTEYITVVETVTINDPVEEESVEAKADNREGNNAQREGSQGGNAQRDNNKSAAPQQGGEKSANQVGNARPGVGSSRINRERKEPQQKRKVAPQEENSMFLVPKNINFDLKLNLQNIVYDGGTIESLVGNATIKSGVVSMEKLSLRTIGAEATSSIVYRNVDRNRSRVFVELGLKEVDINRIGELMPELDTLMPMMKSFEGLVDLELKAVGDINNRTGFDLSKVRAALDVSGRNLVLMDSETFTDLSKLLMFKNKDKNLIDSLALSITADSSQFDVLPFNIVIDRYQAIVGGTQHIDSLYNVNFDYNVSIMKSPLPFKAGVDLKGDLEDFDFDITKAKLKNTDFDKQRIEFREFMDSIESAEAIEDDGGSDNRGDSSKSGQQSKSRKARRPSLSNRAFKEGMEDESENSESDSTLMSGAEAGADSL
ncbi:MAG: AsmA family protein [Rikenellaceae bacterium]